MQYILASLKLPPNCLLFYRILYKYYILYKYILFIYIFFFIEKTTKKITGLLNSIYTEKFYILYFFYVSIKLNWIILIIV